MLIKSRKSVKILTKFTILKGEPLSANFKFFVSELGETYHRGVTERITLSARKSTVIGSIDLELDHFERQGEFSPFCSS